MDITTHSEDPRIARIHHQDYRKRVAIHREVRRKKLEEAATKGRRELYWARKKKDQLALEDEEMMAMYKAMSQGKRVLTLSEVFSKCPYDDNELPQLAIARADWKWVHFRASGSEAIFSSYSSLYNCLKADKLELPSSFFPAEVTNTHWRRTNSKPDYPVKAMVPAVPAHLCPDRLDKYYVLWEAEWDTTPPVDPILLRRLNVHTFSVVAEWNLTPLERSVLHGRPS